MAAFQGRGLWVWGRWGGQTQCRGQEEQEEEQASRKESYVVCMTVR